MSATYDRRWTRSLGLYKPNIQEDAEDTDWGERLNENLDLIDDAIVGLRTRTDAQDATLGAVLQNLAVLRQLNEQLVRQNDALVDRLWALQESWTAPAQPVAPAQPDGRAEIARVGAMLGLPPPVPLSRQEVVAIRQQEAPPTAEVLNTTTPNFGFNMPEVGGDSGIWGGLLNDNAMTLDGLFLNYLPLSGGQLSGALVTTNGAPGTPAVTIGNTGGGFYASGASVGVSTFGTASFLFSLAQHTSLSPINMSNFRITNLATPTQPADAVNMSYVSGVVGNYLPLTGGALSGFLALPGNGSQGAPTLTFGSISSGIYGNGNATIITSLGLPVWECSISGISAAASINMANNRITGLPSPMQPSDAASKSYVDSITSRALLLIGQIDASTGLCEFTATSGYPNGYLPAPTPATLRDFVVVITAGTPPVGPFQEALEVGDYVVSDGAEWVRIAIGGAAGTGDSIVLTPPVFGSDVLQTALENAEAQFADYLPLSGGQLTGQLVVADGSMTMPGLQIGGGGNDGTGFWRSGAFVLLSLQGQLSTAFTSTLTQFYSPVGMLSNKITQLGDATAATDALNQRSGDARYLSLSGGTLSGALTLAADGVAPMQAVTLQQLQAVAGGEWTAGPVSSINTTNLTIANGQLDVFGIRLAATAAGSNLRGQDLYLGAGAATDVGQAGGSANLFGGAGGGGGGIGGGGVAVIAGSGGATAPGGQLTLNSGGGNPGGNIVAGAGNGSGTAGWGGSVAFASGNGAAGGNGGAITFTTGRGNGAGTVGGNMTFAGTAIVGGSARGNLIFNLANFNSWQISGAGLPIADPGIANAIWQDNGVLVKSGFRLTGTFLPISGGQLTGSLLLAHDASAALEAVTLQQLEAAAGGGIPEAPTDGLVYGRQGQTAQWFGVLPLTGGSLSGNLNVLNSLSLSDSGTRLWSSPDAVGLTFDVSNWYLEYTRATGALKYVRYDGTTLMSISPNANLVMQSTYIPSLAVFWPGVVAGGMFAHSLYPNALCFGPTDGAGDATGIWSYSDVASYGHSSSMVSYTCDGGGNAVMWGNAGVFNVPGEAWKPGGGMWACSASDLRTKNVLGDYTRGLDAILALRPVRYTRKGNWRFRPEERNPSLRADTLRSPDYQVAEAGTEFIGLLAQEAEVVMPEMVIRQTATIDGEDVDDLRGLDPNALTYALINSMKEIDARLRAGGL